MLKVSGECLCGFKRDIECDDSSTMQELKDMPCKYCGGLIKYKKENEN